MKSELPAFNDALVSDEEARQTFTWLGPLNQQEFLTWIKSAASETECRSRIQAAIDMLAGRDVVRRH
jgi:uncharacterized protein YdeI (YjbR/CyaY-like superfamily)